MQQIIVNIIVAGAVLFMVRWIYKSFVSKRSETPTCGNCAQCTTDAKPAGPAAAVRFKG